ncbi:lysophospholipase L1-like esterase [Anoxybacillus vitaminiphilus]|uniref:Lysophospholipase L1-like esterase n=2 Tax=Paranoxybacillus vitaminiphilus TaxID=581036 RepID=A0A327YD14_9BACL|nr:lysophospholipase L1-like esterase [Anoxybacillus vitaminiphilus]
MREFGLTEPLTIAEDFFPRDMNIVALGDSLTEGVGDRTKSGGYLAYLEQKLLVHKAIKSVAVTNLGKRGLRISQLDKVVNKNKDVLQQADMIMITIGGNDMMKVVRSHFFDLSYSLFAKEQKQFAVKLEKLLKTLRSINEDAPIVLFGLYNPFGSLQAIPEIEQVIQLWNEGSKEIMDKYENTVFVEVADLFANRDDVLYSDQFHPNDVGYQLMAERVYERLETEETLVLWIREQ